MIVTEERYLEHYGVKGMKWGIRNKARRVFTPSQKALTGKRAHAGMAVGKFLRKTTVIPYQTAKKNHAARMQAEKEYVDALIKREAHRKASGLPIHGREARKADAAYFKKADAKLKKRVKELKAQ